MVEIIRLRERDSGTYDEVVYLAEYQKVVERCEALEDALERLVNIHENQIGHALEKAKTALGGE